MTDDEKQRAFVELMGEWHGRMDDPDLADHLGLTAPQFDTFMSRGRLPENYEPPAVPRADSPWEPLLIVAGVAAIVAILGLAIWYAGSEI
jgi:hypothetical protein